LIQFEHLEDLLATAQRMEIGAADRYMEYAEAASTENPEISALFSRLAEEEREHEDHVLQLAEEASVDLSNVIASAQQTDSENNENTEQVKHSLYEILAAAVKREEQAFEIYTQIAASSKNDDVRRYAKILAKEELGHAALLRAMRRRVYQEHKVQTTSLLPGPEKVHSVEEFLTTATLLEITLAKYIENIAKSGVDMNSSQEHIDAIVNQLKVDIYDNADEDYNEFDIVSNNLLSDITTFTLDKLLTECESIYEYYDSFVLKTDNEAIMNKALFLASETLTQLSLLQDIKNNITDK
jgi:rubrerythrin